MTDTIRYDTIRYKTFIVNRKRLLYHTEPKKRKIRKKKLTRRLCVRWGPNPLPKRGRTQFSTHFYCGQTAGCINVPLGMEVGLSLGDCVTWGPSPLPQKGRSPTQFSAAWIKIPLGTEVGLRQGTLY